MNKRLMATMVTQVISALLMVLNSKLNLQLPTEAIVALAGSMGVTAATYLVVQTSSDKAETAAGTDE